MPTYRAFRVTDGNSLIERPGHTLTDSGQLVSAIVENIVARMGDSPSDTQEHLDYAAYYHKIFIEASPDPTSDQLLVPHREVLVGDSTARDAQVAAMYGTPTVITGRSNVQVAFSPELEDKPDPSTEEQIIIDNTTLVASRAARERSDSYDRYIGEINAMASAAGRDVIDPQQIRDWLTKLDNPTSGLPDPPEWAEDFIADARAKGLIP